MPFHAFDELVICRHLPLDFVAMVPKIRERRIDVRHRELRKSRNNFVRRQALYLVPDVNVLDPNARSRHTRLAAANAGIGGDVSYFGLAHNRILADVLSGGNSGWPEWPCGTRAFAGDETPRYDARMAHGGANGVESTG